MEGFEGPAKSRVAPAKVNLALHVVGRRPDGYHLLESLVAFDPASGDRVEVSLGGEGKDDRLTVDGPFAAQIPSGANNMILQATSLAREVFAESGAQLPPLAIHLTKNLPVAAGIGGGSADAAALLALLLDGQSPELQTTIEDRSIALGADVPMCLKGLPARISGIGERIEPISTLPALTMLLVNPGIAVSTPEVFRLLAARDNPPLPPLPASGFVDLDALVNWLGDTRNDLALPAASIAPEIGEARRALLDAGAVFARMSGSGATVYGLFASSEERETARRRIAADQPGWWVSGAGEDMERTIA